MNNPLKEYQQTVPKTMAAWVKEAKQRLAELRAVRQRIEQNNENK
jgi:hypothetical protein